ncbi:MFS transporter [Paenibacillus amylolyticus]|nr:MFS transporter [Paenibacillus amylolyticus]WFR63353.1 MFS transporter [Paenibacillus amylolyticus]
MGLDVRHRTAAGFGFGMVEAVIGTIIIAAIKDNTAIAMSRLEVLFGIGAMVMPLVASGLIAAGYWRLSFLVVAICAALTFVFWVKGSFGELDQVLDRRKPVDSSRHSHTGGASGELQSAATHTSGPTYRGRNLTLMVLFVLFFFLYVGTEMSLANFMPAILIEKMNMREAGAALSVTCFWIAMSVGRLFAGYIAEKFQYRVYVLYSCLASVLLLMVFPFTNQIWSAFLIILLLGLAMSGIFSIALVFASKLLPGTEESTPSILIASGGVGGAILPLVTGWSLDHLAVNQSAWMLAIFAVGLLVISVITYQWQNKHIGDPAT